MSNINLLEAIRRQIWYMWLKLTLCALCVHTKCRKDRSSFRIMCSWVQRTWKTSQEVDSGNTFKLFSSRRLQKRKVRLLSAQLIVAQRVCESSYTYKYDSNMEILLTLMLATFRNLFYQSFVTVVKSAALFILENFILHNQVCT